MADEDAVITHVPTPVKLTVVPVIEQPVPPWLVTATASVGPVVVFTSLTVLPRFTPTVWAGGDPPVPLVKVMTGVALTTVIARFDVPEL